MQLTRSDGIRRWKKGNIKNSYYQLEVVIENENKGEIIYIPYGGIG
jgi:ferredoxin-fold anticodon binding domain-containing protein